MKVLVKRTTNSESYHKDDGDGTPACGVEADPDPDEYKNWDRDEADVWRHPCQNPGCWGDKAHVTGELTDESTA